MQGVPNSTLEVFADDDQVTWSLFLILVKENGEMAGANLLLQLRRASDVKEFTHGLQTGLSMLRDGM